MMMRKDVFLAIGQFDNTSIWGMEDIELSIRHWLMGHSIVVVPNAEVAHLFKKQANFIVGWKDWVYNALRCALLHFDGSRLTRILNALERHPEVCAATVMLLQSDIWQRLDFTAERKQRDSDWLCEKFQLRI